MKLCTIEVTEVDIKNGKRGSRHNCPIALATKRMFPDAFRVDAYPFEDCQTIGLLWNLHVNSFKGSLSFDLKGEPSKKANHFDHTGEMEPFSFDIEI